MILRRCVVGQRQQCIATMQIFVNARLDLLPWSEVNDPQSNLIRQVAQEAKEKGVMKFEDEDHSFLMEMV